jgi:hypothetical protein
MTFQGDPYRTLGVAPGASLNEIRSAYRRLAKKYHPDAAGERALPRFLAIQAAYEVLVDGEGRLRPPGAGPRRPATPDPWRADPARARASRDAWRARRSGSGGTAGHRPSGGGAPGAGRGASSDPSGARPGSASGASTGARSERHHRRGPRKATSGSTTYDEAAETPLDPEWDGGAWYGPSSGTYWTLNPREYADPRKHGPEYLARARRATVEEAGNAAAEAAAAPAGEAGDPSRRAGGPSRQAGAPGGSSAAAPEGGPRTAGGDEDAGWSWTGSGPTSTEGGEAEWGTRAWTYEARDAGAAWTAGAGAGRRSGAGRGERGPDAAWADAPAPPDLEEIARRAFPESLLALARRPDRRWRLVLALAGWPPIGWAIGTLVSTATGCASYSAACPEPVPVLVLLLQPLVIAALFRSPAATAIASFAALAALAVAVPVGAVLSVGALPRPVIEPVILGVVVATTWFIAVGAAAIRLFGWPNGRGRAP